MELLQELYKGIQPWLEIIGYVAGFLLLLLLFRLMEEFL